ncbi:MAG: hypothetical protein AAF340_11005 [Pseudomonadota bacterium]
MKLNSPTLSRRHLLVLGGSALATGAFAQSPPDRPVATYGRRALTCDNTGVLTSDGALRLAQPVDFERSTTCKMIPDSFEGPYFICVGNRGKAIAAGRPGLPLTVAFRVQSPDCAPLSGAVLDIWACDAEGYYSGHDVSPDVPVSGCRHKKPDTPDRFCRGTLAADADGIVEFDTVYPGFYVGRAIHIHFKVHWQGRSYLTNQSLFSEAINAQVMQMAPYNQPRAVKRRSNASERRWGLAEFSVVQRGAGLLAMQNVVLPSA